eukprot:SAG11_NODE_1741_length_4336_cov_1.517583_10_plen_37_part_00
MGKPMNRKILLASSQPLRLCAIVDMLATQFLFACSS